MGYGGSVEIETSLGERNAFGAALPLPARRAHRVQRQPADASDTELGRARCRRTLENTWSLAIEDTFAATDEARSRRGRQPRGERPRRRRRSSMPTAGPVRVPDGRQRCDQRAGRGVLAVRRRAAAALASYHRARAFPTIFERFSTRFGNGNPEPGPRARSAPSTTRWAGPRS